MLKDLGVFGLGRVETPILAGLVLGDPILLVGSHGTAKTTLCRRLAEALELRFWAYPANLASFDDVLGFPSPAALSEGRVEYASTPVSIWDKEAVLVDELSRAAPGLQGKWFEVLRARTLLGKPLERLAQVFAAMNPPTYLGAQPLDEALIGRFPIVVELPAFSLLPRDVRERIAGADGEDDARAVATGPRGVGPRAGARLRRTIERARALLRAGDPRRRRDATRFALGVAEFLERVERPLDGRRVGMLRRVVEAARAVHEVTERDAHPFVENPLLLGQVLAGALPFPASTEPLPEHLLHGALDAGLAAAKPGGARRRGRRPRDTSPGGRVDLLLARGARLGDDERREAITALITAVEAGGDGGTGEDTARGERAAAWTALGRLAAAVSDGRLRLPHDDASRVLEAHRRAEVLGPAGLGHVVTALHRLHAQHGVTLPRALHALRQARALCDRENDGAAHTDPLVTEALERLRQGAARRTT